MHIFDFFIGKTLLLPCGKIEFGQRSAWISFIYFAILLALAVVASVFCMREVEPQSEKVGLRNFFTWFVCVCILRFFDLFYSFYTAIRRRIDPRRRKFWILLTLLARVASIFGGFAAMVAGIFLLTRQQVFDSHWVTIGFYINLIPLIAIYAIILTPCGCAFGCCFYNFCLEDSPEYRAQQLEDERREKRLEEQRRNARQNAAFSLPLQRQNSVPAQNNDILPELALDYAGQGHDNLPREIRQMVDESLRFEQQRPFGVAPQPNDIQEALDISWATEEQRRRDRSEKKDASRSQFTKKYIYGAFKDILATDDTDECVICYMDFKETDELEQLPCGHYFHEVCLGQYCGKNCPICRQPISAATQSLFKNRATAQTQAQAQAKAKEQV